MATSNVSVFAATFDPPGGGFGQGKNESKTWIKVCAAMIVEDVDKYGAACREFVEEMKDQSLRLEIFGSFTIGDKASRAIAERFTRYASSAGTGVPEVSGPATRALNFAAMRDRLIRLNNALLPYGIKS